MTWHVHPKRSDPRKQVWLSGFYPPTMDDWNTWQNTWSMGPHAEPDWIWFDDYYNEAEARARLAAEREG